MAISDTNMELAADYEDLPRTLRREREARAREAKEREAREREARERETRTLREEPVSGAGRSDTPSFIARDQVRDPVRVPYVYGDDPIAAAVTRFDVPFFRLVAFFLKAVVAAIPALILLGAILFAAGKGLEAYFPELVKMKILITFPNS